MDWYTVSPEMFAAQMHSIARHGWRPVTLGNALRGNLASCPERALVLTFDDGFASNREHAWPILERYGFPSATFIVTERLGGVNSWDGSDKATYRLLSLDDLQAADPRLMTFCSHSGTHPQLTCLTDSDSRRRELEDSRHTLALLPINTTEVFAYPFGTWTWEVMQHVRNAGTAVRVPPWRA